MVRELAVLQLEAGAGAAFEAAFAGVVPLLAAADGYRRHRLVAARISPTPTSSRSTGAISPPMSNGSSPAPPTLGSWRPWTPF